MSEASNDILVPFGQRLIRARWVRRYKRFLIDVELESGQVITAHCPDPGRMTTAGEPGCEVRLSFHDDPRRKLSHTLELVRVDETWVLVNNIWANRIVARALEDERIAELQGYSSSRREVRVADRSRLDFLLERGQERCWVEVKSVTLVRDGVASFPDAVTKRGARHLDVLSELARAGDRAVSLFVLQRDDAKIFEPADDVDPAYGEALRRAEAAGVEVLVYELSIGPRGLGWNGPLLGSSSKSTPKEQAMPITTERVYDFRNREKRKGEVALLVDRLWPRGVRKESLEIDAWLKDVAPSTELRKWFHAEDRSWDAFRRRYLAELKQRPNAVEELRAHARGADQVTLLYATRDTERNHAQILQGLLTE